MLVVVFITEFVVMIVNKVSHTGEICYKNYILIYSITIELSVTGFFLMKYDVIIFRFYWSTLITRNFNDFFCDGALKIKEYKNTFTHI